MILVMKSVFSMRTQTKCDVYLYIYINEWMKLEVCFVFYKRNVQFRDAGDTSRLQKGEGEGNVQEKRRGSGRSLYVM